MIKKRDILKMVQAVHRQNQGGRNRRLIYPAREWGIGLFITAVLFVAGIAYAVYTFNTYNMIEDTIDPPVVETVRYQAAAVERALETYNSRRLQATALSVVPALPSEPATSTAAIEEVATSTTSTSSVPVPFLVEEIQTELDVSVELIAN